MCGFAGVVGDNIQENISLIHPMLEIIKHRGPDDQSVYQHKNMILGHCRLSIIDLETGNQPIFNEDGSVVVIFNGEIYNYQKLTEILINRGHIFKTKSDTEILVHAYEEYGIDFIKKLNGIFAFALLDKERDILFLVRDQFGVKPLHYYFNGTTFIFGSEQKSILIHPTVKRELNHRAFHSQLNLRYTQGTDTLFKGIKRLAPGNYLVYKEQKLKIEPYWKLKVNIDHSLTEKLAMEKLNALLKQAVKKQIVSDVKLGVYLSGGMDSSSIVQKMSELNLPEINTFTLGFNEPTDEFADADIIARTFNTNHHTISLEMEPIRQFPEVIWHAEEPKINLLQGFNMSKTVKKDITVVLGGLGGDELFAGYDIHRYIFPLGRWQKNIPEGFKKIFRWKSDILFKIQNASQTLKFDEYRRGIQMLLAIGDIERYYLILRNVWEHDLPVFKLIYHKDILNKMQENTSKITADFSSFFQRVEKMHALDQVLYTEFHTKMVNDYLLVEDRMSMANSVEERVPFLDIDLVNFAFSIPIELKMKYGNTKNLFRKAMEGKLPNKILKKKKWGFTVNPYLQYKKDLKFTAEKILTEEFIEQQGLFNYDYIKRILNYPTHPKLRWHYNFLWIALGFAIWEKMFISSDYFKNRIFQLEDYYS
jgi:asparagine synthase (glutamine-hydrolysing)